MKLIYSQSPPGTFMKALIAGLVLAGGLVVLQANPQVSVKAKPPCDTNCNLSQYAVQPVVEGRRFYGVQGSNTTIDPIICDDFQPGESDFVNSIYVYMDWLNGIELGWLEEAGGAGRRFFGVRVKNGYYERHVYDAVLPFTNHTYKMVSKVVPGGDTEWEYYVDGDRKDSWFHLFQYGVAVAAAQERHSLQDIGQTHWWGLKYADYWRNFYNWSWWTRVQDNDPYYQVCFVSPAEFWVKTSCR